MAESLDTCLASATEPIVIFSYAGCPFCRKVEGALAEAKLPFKVIDFDADLDDGQTVHNEIHAKHKQKSVPLVFVKGKFIGGCNDGPEEWMGTMPLLKSGKLAAML
ncbi:hypothetical protein CYMTET_9898 [Cymbomonas tetramitiformis]|uniref:GST N-terminal domain-containing protein n=1 Tax=Cymbomonas tetramitiformis TaxID=36881 RepID=A0AAE0GQ51_9CHLO|nr:hypothetical protein CYMTET_9898 [Cymbomonas tetramitiformis]